MEVGGLQIVSVSMSVDRAARDLAGALGAVEAALEPGREDRMVFLPPLVASLSGLDPEALQAGLDPAIRQAARGRRGRSWGVWFAYPKASRQRRRWLMQHDRVHATLRGPIADLARSLGCTVVAGTALLDHPRTHWEAWPHTGSLFHTAWSFGPDGEPFDVLRDGEPRWKVLGDCGVDGSRSGAGGLLNTPSGPVAVDWGEGPSADGAWIWRPRASATESDAGRSENADRRPLVVSGLYGSLGGELVDETQILIRSGFTATEARPPEAGTDVGVAWCAAETGAQL
jgi:hypothetical protein